jgi:hypothetical protein
MNVARNSRTQQAADVSKFWAFAQLKF